MKDIIKINLVTLCLLAIYITCDAQTNVYPEVGKPMPEFQLKGTKNVQGGHITNNDLKGIHYVLDFWNTGCLGCIAGFPKMDSLQFKHRNELKIILIGLEEKNRDVRAFYDIYRKKFDLKISSAFDSTTFLKFVPRGVPHLIWVDNQGIVKAITSTPEVTDKNVEAFLNGTGFSFFDRSYKGQLDAKASFSREKPLLIDDNGGSDTSYLYRSIISIWQPGKGEPKFSPLAPRKRESKSYYLTTCASPEILYILAYFGAVLEFPDTYIDPELSNEAKDILQRRYGNDPKFNYSIEMPNEVATTEQMMRTMQNDLSSVFGLDARIVTKPMPCYNLVVTDKEKFSKLVSIGDDFQATWGAEFRTQKFNNLPIDELPNWLKSKILFPKCKRIIVYNETGSKNKISFEIDADVNSLASIRKGLQFVGLDLVPSARPMRVIEVSKGRQ